jgi:hypothetical protein
MFISLLYIYKYIYIYNCKNVIVAWSKRLRIMQYCKKFKVDMYKSIEELWGLDTKKH